MNFKYQLASLLLSLYIPNFSVNSQVNGTGARCMQDMRCPKESPCCNDVGFCGTDAVHCTLNCFPIGSFGDDTCKVPNPCKSTKYDFTGGNVKTAELATFFGDSLDQVDFLTDGTVGKSDEGIVIKMPKGSKGGSRLISTNFLLYGKVTARMKTGRTGGVVTSFITMSNIKDEIDFEWVGKDVKSVQSNVFYRGQTDYTKGSTNPVSSDTSQNFHDYTIDWSPDSIKWYVDGNLIRTYNKADSLKQGTATYPSTPSRVEIALWNGGSNAPGTREWAGGEVNWDSEDIKKQGYFSAVVASIEFQCSNAPFSNSTKSSGTNTKSSSPSASANSNSSTQTFAYSAVLTAATAIGTYLLI